MSMVFGTKLFQIGTLNEILDKAKALWPSYCHSFCWEEPLWMPEAWVLETPFQNGVLETTNLHHFNQIHFRLWEQHLRGPQIEQWFDTLRVLHLISCRSYCQSDHHGFGALGILAWPIMKPALQRSLTSWIQGNAWQMEFSSIPVHVCLVGKCCARSAFTTFIICCLLLALLVSRFVRLSRRYHLGIFGPFALLDLDRWLFGWSCWRLPLYLCGREAQFPPGRVTTCIIHLDLTETRWNKHHKKLHGTTSTLYEIFFIPINGDAEWELCRIHWGHCWNLHCWFFLAFATRLQLRHIYIMRRVCIYLIIPIQICVHSCTHIITYPHCPILRCCCKDELELLEAFVPDLSKGA